MLNLGEGGMIQSVKSRYMRHVAPLPPEIESRTATELSPDENGM